MENLCPVDGRYRTQTEEIRLNGFTEKCLILTKANIELKWLLHLTGIFHRTDVKLICGEIEKSNAKECLESIINDLNKNPESQNSFIKRVTEIEQSTKHDTKAVELAIRERLQAAEKCPKILTETTHFGLTSEDITGSAYALMFYRVYEECLRPRARELVGTLMDLAEPETNSPMLSMTHGQPASPTTFGKEICVFLQRLSVVSFTNPFFDTDRQRDDYGRTGRGAYGGPDLCFSRPSIKFGGAVGCFSALSVALPHVDWLKETECFVRTLTEEDCFCYDPHDLGSPSFSARRSSRTSAPTFALDLCTTQIPNREWMLLKLRLFELQNNILLDLAKDFWLYISRGLLTLAKGSDEEVGSSVMPHKINPIDFENAEGNLAMANGIINILCTKLSQSRAQRDLSDSTVIRNLGLVFSYTLIAYKSLLKGLGKISFDRKFAISEIKAHPELAAEPLQTIMRKYPGVFTNPYEQLKALTRGTSDKEECLEKLLKFVTDSSSKIAREDQAAWKMVLEHPEFYTGLADKIAQKVIDHWTMKLEN